jgi:hypothetical protein
MFLHVNNRITFYFVKLLTDKNVTYVENWNTMHQHHDGQWINKAAEEIGVSFSYKLFNC